MAWKRDLAQLIAGLENTQFPFASIEDDLADLSRGIAEIEGAINEPVRQYLEHHVQRIAAKHQRCMGIFAAFHAMLKQQARAEQTKGKEKS